MSLSKPKIWLYVWLIMAGVVVWGIYHGLGAYFHSGAWGLMKALVINGFVLAFLGFWAVMLWARSRRQQQSDAL